LTGQYWSDGRGCVLGCLTKSKTDAYKKAQELFGISLTIGRWIEFLFEYIDESLCKDWAIDSLTAIPVSADMSKCHHWFWIWALSEEAGLLKITDINRDIINSCLKIHELCILGIHRYAEIKLIRFRINETARNIERDCKDHFPYSYLEFASMKVAISSIELMYPALEWIFDALTDFETEEMICAKTLEIFSSAPVCDYKTEVPEETIYLLPNLKKQHGTVKVNG
jgi:hypothetical protein